MKRKIFGFLTTVIAIGLGAGCVDDPTGTLSGAVAKVISSRSFTQLSVGDSVRITARAVDAQGNSVPSLPQVTSADESIVTVSVDQTVSGKPLPETVFFVKAVGPGQTQVNLSAGGASSVIQAIGFPLEFTGAVSVNSSGPVDVITVSSTDVIKFDPDNAQVTVDGQPTFVQSRSADAMEVVLVSASAVSGGTVSVSGMVFLGQFALGNLDATQTVDIRAAPAAVGAPDAGPDLTAGPFPLTVYTVLSGSSPNAFFTLNPGADLPITVTLDWFGGDDNDILWCDAGCSAFVGNFSGATLNHPEVSSVTVPAGTLWNLWLNLYSGTGGGVQVTITSP